MRGRPAVGDAVRVLEEELGSFDAWFFHGAGEGLDEWAARPAERPVWEALRPFGPSGARFYRERV